MRPSFHARLINPPFDDPGVLVSFAFEKRAFLFDLGDLRALSSQDILKVSHIFVSHTHMDHFFGFDHLLRLCLGREKKLTLYGPPGIIGNTEGKLAGYTWNLVERYPLPFSLQVCEVHPDHLLRREYRCQDRFAPAGELIRQPFSGILLAEPALSVSGIFLDHQVPCLGFSLQERFHVNILKERLREMGLDVGPWIRTFKQALFDEEKPDTVFEVPSTDPDDAPHRFHLGELTERIVKITPGQKLAYVTDTVFSPSNAEKIVHLARHADHLFIEAVFLEDDAAMGQEKYHLTAHQAGTLAGRAGVKQFTVFHFSPRYTDQENLLYEEAEAAFQEGKTREEKTDV